MHALALLLLLAAAAVMNGVERPATPALTALAARQLAARSSFDPCALGRELGRQPPCLARGDCRALELWRRAFGAPRFEPLRPGRIPPGSVAIRGPSERPPLGRPGRQPRIYLPRSPFAFCPAAEPDR